MSTTNTPLQIDGDTAKSRPTKDSQRVTERRLLARNSENATTAEAVNIPKYCKRKTGGSAYAYTWIEGKQVYLGKHSEESKARYEELVSEHAERLANSQPQSVDNAVAVTESASAVADPTRSIDVTDRLRKAMSMRLDNGSLKERTYKGRRRIMEAAILTEIAGIVRRPIDVDDVCVEIAELLTRRWQKQGLLVISIRRRLEWFRVTNEVAAELMICPRIDFSAIEPQRGFDWKKDRRAIPMPEVTAEPSKEVSGKGDMPLLELIDKHYYPARLMGKSINTLRLYRQSVRNFAKYLGRTALVNDLTTETVAAFLDYSLKKTTLARDTIQKDRTQLVAIANWAAKKGWLSEFLQIGSINCPKKVPDSYTDDELLALFNACNAAKGAIGSIPASDWWTALLSVIYDTGERIGAVMATEATGLDASGQLTIRGEHRKGGKQDTRIRLQPVTVERLKLIQRPGQKKLFPFPYCPMYLWTLYKKLLIEAGLPSGRRAKFHKLRRTVASKFTAAGGDATDLLGHQNRSTTVKNYIDPSVIKTVMPADVLAPFGSDPAIVVQPEAMPEDADKLNQILAILQASKA